MSRNIFGNSFWWLFILLLTLVAGANGQDRKPDQGFKAGNSYAISDIESVNLTNGNVVLNLPLASLPKGRAGGSHGITLNFNSKMWNSRQERRNDGVPIENGSTEYIRELLELTDAWTIQSSYQLVQTDRLALEERAECKPYNEDAYAKNPFRWKVEVKFPDGSSKEFRPYGSGFNYYEQDGYFAISINGTRVNESLTTITSQTQTPVAQCSVSTTQITSGMNYFSTDGSAIRLFVPYRANPTDPLRWTMYFPDGTTVETGPPSDPGVQKITDRNGNSVRIMQATYNSMMGIRIEDDLGRFIFYGTETSTGDTKVFQSGFNNETLVTTIKWKDYWVYRRYKAYTGLGGNPNTTYEDVNTQIRMVDKIILPVQVGSLEYLFTYNASATQPPAGNYTTGWAEIKSVTTPAGATAHYTFQTENNAINLGSLEIIDNRIVRKDLNYVETYDGVTTSNTDTWIYNSSPLGGSVQGPDGSSQFLKTGNILWGSSNVYREQGSDGTRVEKIWAENYAPSMPSVSGQTTNSYVKTEFRTLPDAAGNPTLTAIKDFTYDKNGNVLEIREYDWVPYSSIPHQPYGNDSIGYVTGIPASAVLKRITANEYYDPTPIASDTTTNSPNHYANPSSPKLKNVIKSSEVKDAGGNTVSRSEFIYDDPTNKGNLVETRVWDSFKGGQARAYSNPLTSTNSITTSATYNQYGMPLTTTDANNVVTTITYDCIDGSTSCSSTLQDLYPTKTETASNHPTLKRTSAAQYDFYTGLVTTATDVDNNVSVVTEYDALGRPTKVRSAAGITGFESWTRTEYDDVNRRVVVRSDIETIGDGRKVVTQFYDQLGRVRLAKTLEDAATQSATNETDGIKVQTRYKTVSGYTYQLTSNPYRASYSTNETDATMGWTLSTAWSNGRRAEVQTFSGAALPLSFGGNNTNSTGIVRTDIDADRTLVTDQAGKQRRSITNALGALVRVDEPNDAGQLGSVTAPNQPTSYSYNTLGKMVRVQQGVQNRYFMYDSLGRLLRVKQPEQEVNTSLSTTGNPDNNSWSAGFSYDNNGNVLTTTDAKGTTITNTYDALNRPLTRVYSNEPQGVSTPAVTNYYDGLGLPSVPQFSKGKLTRVTSNISDSRYTQFDAAGRLTGYQQITDGQTYTSSYQYNLSGALTQETYPSGRVVKNEFETDGDLAKVTSQKAGGSVYVPYASNISYSAAGAVTSMRLGNGKFETTQFNSRLQPVQLGLGASVGNSGLWKVNYEYGELQTNGTVDAGKNNGNIAKQTLTVPGTNFVQAYKYDPLNRLSEAKETTGSTQNWIQNWSYDIYGNRSTFTQNIAGNTSAPNPTVDPNTNRFVTGQGFVYDKNGNVIQDVDAATAQSRTFIFNGDNKQTQVKDVNNNIIGQYFYDGEGKRVKKVTNTETTIFVYSAGKLVAEYSTQLSATPSINYTTTDHLGSPRIITAQLGQVKSRRDFLPFGEEIASGTGGRTTAQGYGGQDSIRQKFTGYQKDAETSLDFAEARMYENVTGRFTAVDPTLKSVGFDEPQTWNRYIYVTNNPLRFVDPFGLWKLQTYYLYTEEEYEEDGEKKKRYVLQGTVVTAIKSKDGDNAETLLAQLGVDKDSEEGKALMGSIGDSGRVRLSSLSGEVGEAFSLIEGLLGLQKEWTDAGLDKRKGSTAGPPASGAENCAETCTRLAFPGVSIDLNKIYSSPEYADSFYKNQKNISESETKFLDAVRYADGSNTATHFANAVFKQDNGSLQVFSRSGIRGRIEIVDATALQGGSYGKIRGIGRDQTGYYSRTEKRK